LDAPGHGLSGGDFLSVPVYSDLIQAFILGLGEVHTVIGHSLGGFSLLYTFHRHPLLPIRRIILMASPGEASDFVNVYRKALGLSDKAVSLISDEFVSRYNFGPEYFSAPKFAQSVNIPGLIIHDVTDIEAPYRHAEAIHESWSKSRLIKTEGLGHNLKSASVVEHVVNFVNETSNTLAAV
jgi:pimeloyl-ACP methyl ester carboxylesterase